MDETLRIIEASNKCLTVQYRGHYLYSKYCPQKAALAAVASAARLPGTLYLVCSPVLCYGMAELIAILSDDCFVAAVESCEALYEVGLQHFSADARCALIAKDDVDYMLQELCRGKAGQVYGKIRRCVRVDLSAGVQFDRAFYDSVFVKAQEAIARYWKNRATLIKHGRLYSHNLLRNIARLPQTVSLARLRGTVKRPILVLGAGESMQKAVQSVLRNRNSVYVMAVDAAAAAVVKMGLVPDAIVSEEAQTVIASCFVGLNGSVALRQRGCRGNKTVAFLSLTGWSGAFSALRDICDIAYYATRYADASYLDDMASNEVLPPMLPPMGSVGLTATRLALMLRSDAGVYVAGLDFSYSVGATHARGTAPCINRLCRACRISPYEVYAPSFAPGAMETVCKAGIRRTMPNMAAYAALFAEQFGAVPRLFDCGGEGIPLGIPVRDIGEVISDKRLASNEEDAPASGNEHDGNGGKDSKINVRDKVVSFYDREEEALQELCALIEGGGTVSADGRARLDALLRCREYLYLHFPDYTGELDEQITEAHFTARVDCEARFFLKDIQIGRRLMHSD